MPIETIIQGAVSGLLSGGVLALIALGLTLIWGVMNIFNLAHADFVVFALFAGFALSNYLGFNPYMTLLVIVPLFFGLGILVAKFIVKPTMKYSLHLAFLVTLAMMLLLQSIMTVVQYQVFNVQFAAVDPKYWMGSWKIGGINIDQPTTIAFLASIAFSLAMYWLIHKTDIGRSIRAASENPKVAGLMGINVNRTHLITFGLGIASAAAAAALMLPTTAFDSGTGNHFNLTACVIVVLGGLGSFTGTLVAGLIVGFAQGLAGVLLPGSLGSGIGLVILILVLLFRPQGLFGAKEL